jgi:hypothetical protein
VTYERYVQCYVLVGDVLDVIEKLMLNMTMFRDGFFHRFRFLFPSLFLILFSAFRVHSARMRYLLCDTLFCELAPFSTPARTQNSHT